MHLALMLRQREPRRIPALRPQAGAVGDASVIAIEEGQFTYHDVLGEPVQGTKKLAAKGIVVGGRWWHSA
jgi:hypothetical protein